MTVKLYRDPGLWTQPDQYAVEFAALLDLYREVKPKTVLEIGVREGGTFLQWMKHAQAGTTLIGIDLPRGKWGSETQADYLRMWDYANFLGLTISVILGNSHDNLTKRAVKQMAPMVDWLFIDGDHSFNGVKDDFEFYSELVVPGGVIALHDIYPDSTDGGIQVSEFWEWIKEDYRSAEYASLEGQDGYGIGVICK